MQIRLTYGSYQLFRYRHRDLNVLGRVEQAAYPLGRAIYRLNDGPERLFYVDPVADPGIDWTSQYKDSPAVLRLKDQGDFNVELPADSPQLAEGSNTLLLLVQDQAGSEAQATVTFEWNPRPVPLPLDLSDLSLYRNIQELGQVVNGAFDLDPERNVIRSRAPVYPDALLLLGSPHGAQEATYRVRFTELMGAKWLGPSDFFVGHEEADPPIGIKPGWSSAGMIALNPRGEARSFIAFGDHCGTKQEWVVVTRPPARFQVAKNVDYRIRHQVEFAGGVNRVRWRIWPEGDPEPRAWICEESDAAIDRALPRHQAGAFGLFQHSGMPIEWSDLRVVSL
jgi:hypothetical protein